MIRTIIVEDENKARETLVNMLGMYCPSVDIVDQADCVEKGVKSINYNNPDLVFLDIQMPDGTGFDLLKKLKDQNFKLVFTTAFEEYAIKAFKFSAIDYLLKPIDPEDLVKTITKIERIIEDENNQIKLKALLENIETISTEVKKIVLKTAESIHIVKVKDIIRCESSSNYTSFFFRDGKKLLVSKTLKEFDEMLSDYGFFRVHQSHLVNTQYITSFEKSDGGFLAMSDDSKIPVSYRKKESLLKLFDKL
jgi:two-component system, LytTR family, response regulator